MSKLFIIVLATVATMALSACAAQEEEASEEPAVEETTTDETTEYVSPGIKDAQFRCSLNKANASSMTQEEADELVESATPEHPLPEILEEEGYGCSVAEARELLEEEQAQREAHQQEFAEQQAKTGKNEAGQDVSNIPKTAPDASRGACFLAYFESLPREERGRRQQEVVAEANQRGVTPYDVVGC
jgi:hypothetical protein